MLTPAARSLPGTVTVRRAGCNQCRIGAMKFWVDTFHLDGIRYDAARALKSFKLMGWFSRKMHERKFLRFA